MRAYMKETKKLQVAKNEGIQWKTIPFGSGPVAGRPDSGPIRVLTPDSSRQYCCSANTFQLFFSCCRKAAIFFSNTSETKFGRFPAS